MASDLSSRIHCATPSAALQSLGRAGIMIFSLIQIDEASRRSRRRLDVETSRRRCVQLVACCWPVRVALF